MCVSGHIPGWPLGEEAQPLCSGSHQDGHAGEPGVHSLLRVFPVPGMRHRTRGRGYCSLWKQVSPQRGSGSPLHPANKGHISLSLANVNATLLSSMSSLQAVLAHGQPYSKQFKEGSVE